jgi:alanyl-tRNA synthetase
MQTATTPVRRGSSSVEVGKRFLDYYRSRGYAVIPGSSLLDPSVPMSFVMSAGLVQVETSAELHGGRTQDRYALLQNCFRYFDLDSVGHSDAHLSFFQMPGAFTFGPMEKQESIGQIWGLLMGVYGFSPKSLWVTYFAGGEVGGHAFDPDVETRRAWLGAGVHPDRIVALGAEHNFWKQGASVVGEEHAPKCGPNTEVFFDLGVHLSCSTTCAPGCRCGRFVEFLNTLFITMHIDDESGVVRPLVDPFTETVVGAERVAMLLQGAASVFEIDGIQPLVECVRGYAREPIVQVSDRVRHERVLADHMRALLYLVADDAPPPGKGGRARLMRKLVRGMLTGQKLLGIADPVFVKSLAEVALQLYASQDPRLPKARETLLQYVAEESKRFEHTLKRGRRRLDRLLKQAGDGYISGKDMVELEKHYGVPEPLLEAILIQKKIQFSRQAYQAAHARWRRAVVGTN